MIMRIGRALHKRTKGEKGFTLIELIVSLSIGDISHIGDSQVVGCEDRQKLQQMK